MAVADLVEATRAGVPDGVLRPRNCHEAALGWLIMSVFAQYRLAGPQTGGVARAWRAVRNISDAHGAAPNVQLTGRHLMAIM